MKSEDQYSYQAYIQRLRALLLSLGPLAAIVVGDGIAASLDADGRLFGYAYDDLNQDEFDFEQSAWHETSWTGETHTETWSVFVAPVYLCRPSS